MSTIQKAFVFIVVVLSVLTAAVTLVLFAQRTNWQQKESATQADLKKAKADADSLRKDLAAAKDAAATNAAALESKIAALGTELENTKRDLDLLRDDKARIEALANELKANYQTMSQNMDTLGERTKELETAKQAAEKALEETRAAAMAAEESLTIAERKAKDLGAQVQGLTDQLAARDEQIKLLQQKVDVLQTYAPPVGPVVTATTEKPVRGKVTSLSKDGSIVFLSVGSDDGVQKGMIFLIRKGPDYVADAKVFDVSAEKSAARVIQPVYGTVAEGDDVTNK